MMTVPHPARTVTRVVEWADKSSKEYEIIELVIEIVQRFKIS